MEDDENDYEASPVSVNVETPEANLEDAFKNLFKTSASGSGEEELLRIASTYSRQITAPQIKVILYLEWQAVELTEKHPALAKQLRRFIDRWLELKQYNNSDIFVMRALESISLRKFIGESAFKVNIEK